MSAPSSACGTTAPISCRRLTSETTSRHCETTVPRKSTPGHKRTRPGSSQPDGRVSGGCSGDLLLANAPAKPLTVPLSGFGDDWAAVPELHLGLKALRNRLAAESRTCYA